MKIIAIGDNVVDCYLDQGIFYPGGNAVNVAVGCKRYGADRAAYMGVFGNDSEAEHLKWALKQEQVSIDHSRQVYAISGHPRVKLMPDGDRVFVGGPKNTAQHIVRIRLTPEDIDYIKEFDVCHTSCYSSLEPELPKLSEICSVSFDFSTDYQNQDYLRQVCPHIRFAFLSGSHLSEKEIDQIIVRIHDLGPEIIGITLGNKGALFSKSGVRYHQPIREVEVVDTMGAGDSFIAGFLTKYNQNVSIAEALEFAADCAAKTCTFYGSFGYGKPFSKE